MTDPIPLEQLLQSLEAVTLEEVDNQIAWVDDAITTATETLVLRRQRLQALRKIIAGRNGEPLRKPRKPRTSPAVAGSPEAPVTLTGTPGRATGSDLAARIAIYLESSGPTKVKTIAEQMGVSYASAYGCLTSKPQFKKTGEGEFGPARAGR